MLAFPHGSMHRCCGLRAFASLAASDSTFASATSGVWQNIRSGIRSCHASSTLLRAPTTVISQTVRVHTHCFKETRCSPAQSVTQIRAGRGPQSRETPRGSIPEGPLSLPAEGIAAVGALLPPHSAMVLRAAWAERACTSGSAARDRYVLERGDEISPAEVSNTSAPTSKSSNRTSTCNRSVRNNWETRVEAAGQQ